MKTNIETLTTVWLNGKYKNGEINTSTPFVSINDPEFYVDGDEALAVIGDIYKYWLYTTGATQEDAFNLWINSNL